MPPPSSRQVSRYEEAGRRSSEDVRSEQQSRFGSRMMGNGSKAGPPPPPPTESSQLARRNSPSSSLSSQKSDRYRPRRQDSSRERDRERDRDKEYSTPVKKYQWRSDVDQPAREGRYDPGEGGDEYYPSTAPPPVGRESQDWDRVDPHAGYVNAHDAARKRKSRHTILGMNYPGVKRHHGYVFVIWLCGLLFPPLAVCARFGIGSDFWICFILTLCGWFPGHAYNFFVQNIRVNNSKARTPKWALKYGLVDREVHLKREKKSQWAKRFNEQGTVREAWDEQGRYAGYEDDLPPSQRYAAMGATDDDDEGYYDVSKHDVYLGKTRETRRSASERSYRGRRGSEGGQRKADYDALQNHQF